MIPMKSPSPQPLLTAEDLAAGGARYDHCELWDGHLLVHQPAFLRHDVVTARVIAPLERHVAERGLGWVVSSSAGFLLARNPDRVLSPDTAFVSKEHLPTIPERGYCPVAPDFCVEVRSTSQSWVAVAAKAGIWIAHGVRVVWAVDPESMTVAVFRPDEPPVEVTLGGAADAGPTLPDFRLEVGDLFRGLGAGGADLMR